MNSAFARWIAQGCSTMSLKLCKSSVRKSVSIFYEQWLCTCLQHHDLICLLPLPVECAIYQLELSFLEQ